jgi:hypothetical protein
LGKISPGQEAHRQWRSEGILCSEEGRGTTILQSWPRGRLKSRVDLHTASNFRISHCWWEGRTGRVYLGLEVSQQILIAQAFRCNILKKTKHQMRTCLGVVHTNRQCTAVWLHQLCPSMFTPTLADPCPIEGFNKHNKDNITTHTHMSCN